MVQGRGREERIKRRKTKWEGRKGRKEVKNNIRERGE